MANHSPIYSELYKCTNHSKQIDIKKEIARFVFNEPSRKRDGLNFIDSDCLRDINNNKLTNSHVYFENSSSENGRKFDKNIRICNIPFSKLPIKRDIIKALNNYLTNSISLNSETNEYISNIESLMYRKSLMKESPNLEYIKSLSDAKGSNKESISKYLYGLQFNSLEFFKATGLLITVYRSCKERKRNSLTDLKYRYYGSGKLSNFEDLNDGKNIRISVQSNSYLEVDFRDSISTDNKYELYDFEYEIDVLSCVSDIKLEEFTNGSNTDKNEYSNDNGYNSLQFTYVYNNTGLIEPKSEFFNKRESLIFKDYININYHNGNKDNSKISSLHVLDDFLKDEYPSNINKNLLYVFGYQLDEINNSLSDEEIIKSSFFITPNNYNIKNYGKIGSKNYISVSFNEDVFEKIHIEDGKEYGNRYNNNKENPSEIKMARIELSINSDKYSTETTELHDIIYGEPYFTPTGESTDEEKLIESLPFYLKDKLEQKTSIQINKISSIPATSITIYNGTPCFKITFDNKHSSVMLFKDNKLLMPSFIEEKNDESTIYIDLSLLVDITNSLLKLIYGKTQLYHDDYIKLKTDSNFYIVYDTDVLFIENMKYPVKSIYKVDPDGKKIKTNDYLLPLNKDINLNNIIIAIEDYTDKQNDNGDGFKIDPEGSYIYLDSERYYPCYNFKYYSSSTKYYRCKDGKYISTYDYNSSLTPDGNETRYHIVNKTIYYFDYNRYYSTEDVYIKINDVYYLLNENTYVNNNELIETITNNIYKGKFYLKYGPGYLIPPFYYDDDTRYIKISKRVIQLSDLVSLQKYTNMVSKDSYINSTDDSNNSIIVENKLYNKQELIKSVILKKYNIDITDFTKYYKDESDNYIKYDSSIIFKPESELYYKTLDNTYVSVNDVKSTKSDIIQFSQLNRVYKFTLTDNDIKISGLGNYEDYTNYLLSLSKNNNSDANILIVPDNNIRAYQINSSYSKYNINSDDEFLAYIIPNQLINSESKMLTFLNGKLSDEYVINKKLFERLFNGNAILSFSSDPEDSGGNDYVYNINKNGDYYWDSSIGKYIKDDGRDLSKMDRVSSISYYKVDDNNYIESYLFDSNDIIDTTTYVKNIDGTYSKSSNGEYYKLHNGEFILVTKYTPNTVSIVDYQKYFELKNEYKNSYFILIKDYYEYITRYSKSISTVYMCSMKNIVLFRDQNNITYDKSTGIFTVGTTNKILKNKFQSYNNTYCPPLSTKYMLFFINGRFSNGDVEILSPTTFYIKSNSNLSKNNSVISQISIYTFEDFLYGLDKYKNCFFTKKEFNDNSVSCFVYTYNDTLWNKHSEELISSHKDEIDSLYTYNPATPGYENSSDLTSLYEIFGKYVLNKYDIDNDYSLYDEIRAYFDELFEKDESGISRMKLELIQDSAKRKYIY